MSEADVGEGAGERQSLAFATLVFGNQAVLFALRERRMWSSGPGGWVLAAAAAGRRRRIGRTGMTGENGADGPERLAG